MVESTCLRNGNNKKGLKLIREAQKDGLWLDQVGYPRHPNHLQIVFKKCTSLLGILQQLGQPLAPLPLFIES